MLERLTVAAALVAATAVAVDGPLRRDAVVLRRLLLADLDFVVNPTFNAFQLGVSVTRCPRAARSVADCTTAFLDQSGADREWITTYGQTAWVAYHDSQNSTMIRVKKSTDDGRTWKASGSPLVGQGDVTWRTSGR